MTCVTMQSTSPYYVKRFEEVLREDGGWQRDTHNKLHKVDIFLKESQRFAPPTLCSSSLSVHLY